jgi:hypothetical protein
MNIKHTYTHCCKRITQSFYPRGMIHFEPKRRSYGIFISDDRAAIDFIKFCPFCGKKFPPNLTDKYYEIVEDLGVNLSDPQSPSDEWVESQIPVEFHSDEWWRSRGL